MQEPGEDQPWGSPCRGVGIPTARVLNPHIPHAAGSQGHPRVRSETGPHGGLPSYTIYKKKLKWKT